LFVCSSTEPGESVSDVLSCDIDYSGHRSYSVTCEICYWYRYSSGVPTKVWVADIERSWCGSNGCWTWEREAEVTRGDPPLQQNDPPLQRSVFLYLCNQTVSHVGN